MSFLPDSDVISRFVFQDGHCNPATGKIHWRSFEPRHNAASGKKEVSVFVVTQLTVEQTEKIGLEHVAKMQGRNPKSVITFPVKTTSEVNLKVEMETSTHSLHANIVDWPSAENDELQRCQELAATLKANSTTQLHNIDPIAKSES